MNSANVDIVLIRMDKMGDLVVSLPVDEHPAVKGRRLHWFITKGLGALVDQALPKRSYSEFKLGFSPMQFVKMVQWLKSHRPEIVVILHAPWWVSLALWWARVPIRMGRLSQWHSFLFLNHGVRQSRRGSHQHESDYNFDLVEFGFNRLGVKATTGLAQVKKSYLHLVPPNPVGTIEELGLKAHGYRVVHPGMGGSALNWPAEYFVELIQKLASEMEVIITGTKADEKFLSPIRKGVTHPRVQFMVDQLKLGELLDVLSQAHSVVAPSTGVLHLAASLGTPVLGIYSPRSVEHPRRWGPKGPRTHFVVPAVTEEMVSPEIMKTLSPRSVMNDLHQLESQ